MEELTLHRDNKEFYATLYGNSSYCVVLCPPHPMYGGNREDSRLVTIAQELANYNISALCIDYSSYTGGDGEIRDTLFALTYMEKIASSLGLLGYSYGAVVASNAAAKFPNLRGLALLSPLKRVNGLEIDLSSNCKKLIIYGSHDPFVVEDIDELYRLAQGEKQRFSLDTDHFYFGYERVAAEAVRRFFHEVFQVLNEEVS